ncbi:hypothetical protein DQ04_00391150 [Trypanosoma grayi]|uniref:hypothetical protein n=1 Tax=Trypanosoma grayi TaxID=71804 RepID=UPI0004F46DEC|nr:hypothetical protein DQ04_00391150 [Trypanosoma grayi]KEG14593.1 hypothetical protein DQ04_00391150 [Trypanosoma grayi]
MRRVVTGVCSAGRRVPWWPTACVAAMQPLMQRAAFTRGVTETSGSSGVEKSKRRRHQPGGSGGPVKDRFPPVATDLSDPRRRLALLIDASSVEPRVFHNTIVPAVLKVGVPVLVRLFAVQLSSEWEKVVAGSDAVKKTEGGGSSSSSNALEKDHNATGNEVEAAEVTSGCPPAEFFRVERFIPVSMQMEADANHIFDFRRQNKIEAVCFVCSEVDRGVFEGFLANIAGNGFNQYVLDELGMAKEVEEDGRSADGTP